MREGRKVRVVRSLGRWGMSARIAKLTITQDSYQSALGWGDYHLLPPFPLPLRTSSRKEVGRLYEEERTRLMNRSSIRKRSRIPFAQLNQQSYPYYPFVSQRNEYLQGARLQTSRIRFWKRFKERRRRGCESCEVCMSSLNLGDLGEAIERRKYHGTATRGY